MWDVTGSVHWVYLGRNSAPWPCPMVGSARWLCPWMDSTHWVLVPNFEDVIHILKLISCFHIVQAVARARGEDVPFNGQPQALGHVEHQPKVSRLNVFLETLTSLVAPAVEVEHALPVEVHPTGSSSLWLGIVLDPRFHVAPSSVGHSCDQPLLPADVFGSPNCTEDLDINALAPLKHFLASGLSSGPPSPLGATLHASA